VDFFAGDTFHVTPHDHCTRAYALRRSGLECVSGELPGSCYLSGIFGTAIKLVCTYDIR